MTNVVHLEVAGSETFKVKDSNLLQIKSEKVTRILECVRQDH